MIDTRSALTVAGWANVVLTDYDQIDRERVLRDGDGHAEDTTFGCWAFGRNTAHGGRSDVASQAASDHNEQIAKLISALGRVVRDAVPFSEQLQEIKEYMMEKNLKISAWQVNEETPGAAWTS